jgi:hypothetical protein
MKFLIVPPDVTLRDLVTRKPTGEAYSFWRWFQEIVLMDQRFSVGWKTGRTAAKLSDLLFEKPAGAVVQIEDADWDLLKEAVEEPRRIHRASGQVFVGYEQPALLQQIIPYIEAIQAAGARLTKPKDAEVLQMPPGAQMPAEEDLAAL